MRSTNTLAYSPSICLALNSAMYPASFSTLHCAAARLQAVSCDEFAALVTNSKHLCIATLHFDLHELVTAGMFRGQSVHSLHDLGAAA